MSREDPPLRIRLPEELKAKVQTIAAENRRSMNAEIVSRLEASFEEQAASDARSQLAAERILRMDLTGQPAPMGEIEALKEAVADLLKRVSKLEGQDMKETPPKTEGVFEAQKKLLRRKATET